MSGFLSLPYELRAIILENALLAPYEPPINPWTGADKRQPLQDIEYTVSSFGPRHTLYDTSLEERLASTCQALLSTNRQICEETKAIVRRLEKPRYLLDVMVVNAWDMWLTWLSVPVVRTHVDELNVTFRLFGHSLTTKQRHLISRAGGNNGPGRCLCAMLERFLVHGPLTEPLSSERQEKKFFIKILTLNIESAAYKQIPFPAPEDKKSIRDSERPGSISYPSDYALRPESLAKDIYGEINRLLAQGYHPGGYGVILYEHIGTIRMFLEGQLVEEIDLGEKLASMNTCSIALFSPERTREFFSWWKRKTLRNRAKEGLSTVWAEDTGLPGYPENADNT